MMGLAFLQAGSDKLLGGEFSAAGYLGNTPSANGSPLADLFVLLDGEVSLLAIQAALKQLEAQGCIVEANGSAPSKQMAFLYALGVHAPSALDQFKQTRISLSAVGNVDITFLQAALEREGVVTGEGEGDLRVVVVDDYLQEGVAKINQQALASDQAWMLVKLVGTKSWIGPIFQPGQTACWACLAQRIRINRQVEAYILRKTERSGPIVTSISATPATLHTAANIATTEIIKWLVRGSNERLQNQLLTYDHLALDLEAHTVVQRPQCPVCGNLDYAAEPHSIQLTEAGQQSANAGFRTRYPEETYNQFKHHISPISGVITSLVDITEEATGLIYTYAAGHYFPPIVDSIFWLRHNLRSNTGGKGTSQIQAKVSAIGEAIERYSTIYWGHEATVRGSYESLADKAIHPSECLGYSASQYANRERWNRELTRYSYQVMPMPFNETTEVDWVPVWSLTNHEFKYVLATLCYYGHPDSRYFFNTIDSNGVAAGNSVKETIIQGFFELVERDSVAIWWYNRIARPGVDLDSFKMPYLTALQQYYQTLNREFWLLDITTDLSIPAFAALSRRVDAPVEDIIYGFGAHFSPQAAIMQAVTEMNQCLPGVRVGPDGTTEYRWSQQDAIDWWQTATIANQPYLLPDSSVATKRLSDYPQIVKDSLRENVELCITIAREAELETLVLDLTRPDIGMNVCRVIVPGLRHFWRRLGPGRLYDVPVKLGWLDQARTEEEMNPFSIFF
jgi:ribosomal protein S12 methylthiotransferase accessory factor